MSTWENAIQAVQRAVHDGCAVSTYGDIDLRSVRGQVADTVDDRQVLEALRYLKQLGRIEAYFGASDVVNIRWLDEF